MKMDISEFSKECNCGKKHAILVKDIFIEKGAVHKIGALLASEGYLQYKKPTVVCDDNTYEAAGKTVLAQLTDAKCIILSPDHLHADEHAVEKVIHQLSADTGLLIAAGSGTIHDITRYVAHEKDIPFISVPTAASVDGFVSTVAAMTWHGFKQSFSSSSPIAVVADSEIFAKAPYRLTASGISDLFGKYTALTDWKISHIVTDEYLCQRIFDMTLEAVNMVAESLDKITACDEEAMEKLMYGLLLSGLAMQMIGNSRPASGAEHHMSHLWEMEILNPTLEAYHGEKVSVGLVLAIRKYQQMRNDIQDGKLKVIDHYDGPETDDLKKYFGAKNMYEVIAKENSTDPLSKVDLHVLKDKLPEVLATLEKLPSVEKIESMLRTAKCTMTLDQIQLNENILERTLQLSPYIRNRLTFMRLAKLFIEA